MGQRPTVRLLSAEMLKATEAIRILLQNGDDLDVLIFAVNSVGHRFTITQETFRPVLTLRIYSP